MSKAKIKRALNCKGITAIDIQYVRDCVVPEEVVCGWDLEFSEQLEEDIYNAASRCEFSVFMEFASLSEVMRWIETLPDIRNT